MYEAQIAAGIALLNERIPDWREDINLDRLNLMYKDTCVLGQVTGWNTALNILDLDHDEQGQIAHGFTLPDCIGGHETLESEQKCNARWATLTDEWRAVLQPAV